MYSVVPLSLTVNVVSIRDASDFICPAVKRPGGISSRFVV